MAAFDEAAAAVSAGLEAKAAGVAGAAAEVLRATAGLARDKGLRGAVAKSVAAGDGVLPSLHGAVDQFAGIFTQMGGLMAERVTDLRDVERRIEARLVGVAEPGVPVPEEPSVLVAEDLAPADTAGLDPSLTVGLVTEKGGPTSHTAIIARQLGIPCVVGVAGATKIASGTKVLLDGSAGTVEIGPDAKAADALVEADRELRARIDAGPGNLFTPAMTAQLAATLRTPPDGAHVLHISATADEFCLGRVPFRDGAGKHVEGPAHSVTVERGDAAIELARASVVEREADRSSRPPGVPARPFRTQQHRASLALRSATGAGEAECRACRRSA